MIKIKYLRKIYHFKKKISIKNFIKKNHLNKNNYIGIYIKKKIFNKNYTIYNDSKLNLINKNSNLGKKIIKLLVNTFKYILKKILPKIKFNKFKYINEKFFLNIKNKISNKNFLKIKKKVLLLIKKYIQKNKQKINQSIKIYDLIQYNLNKKLSNYLIKKNLLFLNIINIIYIKNKKKKIQKICFETKKNKYISIKQKNINTDHRLINKKLDLYHINNKTPGIIFWHYKGFLLLKNIKKLLRKKINQYNYLEVQSAQLINKIMWKKSGHWYYYNNFIFTTKSEKEKLCIKPMNCLGHIDIYKQKIRSYKDLPIRLAEFGICHRNEYSGSLYGLMRTRSFTQDDAHIFCSKKQIYQEISQCIDIIKEIYKIFKFKKINIFISTKPKKYLGKKKTWKKYEKKLIDVLINKNLKFKIKKREGAFYGPKIEFILKDSFNKKWQCGTIQLDFNLPKKLNINFLNKKNKKEIPLIIHRAILGSLERFIGILLENNNGWLPTWLTPIQIAVLSISKKHKKYCEYILKTLKNNNIRSIGDFRDKKINFKIREHTLQKIPYMIVCGDKELYSNTINLRKTLKNNFSIMCIKKLIKKFIKINKY